MVLCLLLTTSSDAQDIPWRNEMFQHMSVDEDVRDVMQSLIDQNGLRVIFLPGVKGSVTYQFSDLPLDAAFKKLLMENSLESTYDPKSRTVTVGSARKGKNEVSLFSPSVMSLDELESTLERFGMLVKSKVDTVFDEATQSVMLRGPNEEVQAVTEFIKTLDDGQKKRQAKAAVDRKKQYEQVVLDNAMTRIKEAANIQVKIFTLKYARVGSSTMTFQGETVEVPGIGETLNTFIGLTNPQLPLPPQPATHTSPTQSQTTNTSTGLPTVPGNFEEAFDAVLNRNSFEPGTPLGKNRTANLSLRQGSAAGASNVRIAVDERTNSVVVSAPPKIIAKIGEAIEKLDQPQQLVEIEVIVAKAEKGVRESLGVQWGGAQRLNKNNNAIGVSGGGTATDQVVTVAGAEAEAQQSTSTTVATTIEDKLDPVSLLPLVGDTFKSSYIYRGSKELFEAQINALSANNQLQTVASPRIVTLDRFPARITKTDKVNIPVTTGDGTKSAVQEVSADISINITPFIISSDSAGEPPELRLEISAKHSTLGAITADGVQTAEQELQTHVVVPDAATFILGGLFDNEKTETTTGIPGLQNIPFLGSLFKTTSVSDTRRETLFFITATVRSPNALTGGRGIGIRDFVHYQRASLHKREDYMPAKKRYEYLNLESLEEDE